jgi:hypothetical protein
MMRIVQMFSCGWAGVAELAKSSSCDQSTLPSHLVACSVDFVLALRRAFLSPSPRLSRWPYGGGTLEGLLPKV